MTNQFKPLLAGTADLLSLKYPLACTPKFDGIRCLIVNGSPVSRTLKSIRNKRIRETLQGLPSILDGEIIAVSGSFQESTTAVMAADSELPWEYHIFDYVGTSLDQGYTNRIRALQELFDLNDYPAQCKLVIPEYVYDLTSLKELCQSHLEQGYEGTMVRDPASRYKCGRSTTRESILLKIKAFKDTEAEIIGFEELMHNDNVATTNALGRTERSTHKENLRSSGTLGAFVVRSIENPDITYSVGTGLTQEQRENYWNAQDQLLGKLVKVKYFEQGIKDRPRFPVFLGFRDPDDI